MGLGEGIFSPFNVHNDALVVAAQCICTYLLTSAVHCVFPVAALRALCDAAEREPMMSLPRRHTIMPGNTSQSLFQD